MLAIMSKAQGLANGAFSAAVVLMSLSLAALVLEVVISGGALKILLERMEKEKS